MKILVLNSGSSSQKSCLYDVGNTLPENPPVPDWEAKIEWNGDTADVFVQNTRGAKIKSRAQVESRRQAIEQLLDSLWQGDARIISALSEIDVVGHRVVHGGEAYETPTIINSEVKAAIQRLSVFAPLHNRAELEGIDVIEKTLANVTQVAVFDTGFHQHLPKLAYVYPGPYEWLAQGIRRYGFHGINHQYCAERTAQLLRKNLQSLKIVTCHLGNGCSLAAIRDGRSIDTTMGFTPLEGLMMGTRSGSVDPSILTFLIRQNGLTTEKLEDLLNKKSGLLGISGLSADMRQIVAAMNDGHSRARLAFDMFVHRLQCSIGATAAALNGIDALVFTAGIGENSAEVRAAACANLNFLGAKLDAVENTQPAGGETVDRDISLSSSAVRVLVIRAQEDWAIARDCWRLVSANHARGSGATL